MVEADEQAEAEKIVAAELAKKTTDEKAAEKAADKIEAAAKEEDDKAAAIKAAEAKKTADEKIAAAAAAEDGGTPAGVHDKGGSPLQDAKETVKQMEEQNKIMSENLAKQEKLQAEMMISGTTPAGQGSLTEDEKKDEEVKEYLKGTGYEDELFPKKK